MLYLRNNWQYLTFVFVGLTFYMGFGDMNNYRKFKLY